MILKILYDSESGPYVESFDGDIVSEMLRMGELGYKIVTEIPDNHDEAMYIDGTPLPASLEAIAARQDFLNRRVTIDPDPKWKAFDFAIAEGGNISVIAGPDSKMPKEGDIVRYGDREVIVTKYTRDHDGPFRTDTIEGTFKEKDKSP